MECAQGEDMQGSGSTRCGVQKELNRAFYNRPSVRSGEGCEKQSGQAKRHRRSAGKREQWSMGRADSSTKRAACPMVDKNGGEGRVNHKASRAGKWRGRRRGLVRVRVPGAACACGVRA
eukprot:3042424-Pleurochrysis_carterae.AAC.1